MTFARPILLMTGLLAAPLAAPTGARAQGDSSALTSMRAWRHTSQGLSPNAALAFYRLRNAGLPKQQTRVRYRRPDLPNSTIYSAPYYAITTHRAVPVPRSNPYPTGSTPRPRKPFAGVHPAPTAVDRYWPLLLEAREDPKTGLVIWKLP